LRIKEQETRLNLQENDNDDDDDDVICCFISHSLYDIMVRGSSVGKATRYGLYGAGIEISCTCLDRPRGAVFSDCHNKIRPFLSTRPFCIINVKCVLCDVCTASYVQFACMTVYLGQGTSGNLQSFPGYISVLLVPILNAKFNTLRNLSPAGSLCCGLFTSVVAAPGGGGGETRDPPLQ